MMDNLSVSAGMSRHLLKRIFIWTKKDLNNKMREWRACTCFSYCVVDCRFTVKLDSHKRQGRLTSAPHTYFTVSRLEWEKRLYLQILRRIQYSNWKWAHFKGPFLLISFMRADPLCILKSIRGFACHFMSCSPPASHSHFHYISHCKWWEIVAHRK